MTERSLRRILRRGITVGAARKLPEWRKKAVVYVTVTSPEAAQSLGLLRRTPHATTYETVWTLARIVRMSRHKDVRVIHSRLQKPVGLILPQWWYHREHFSIPPSQKLDLERD